MSEQMLQTELCKVKLLKKEEVSSFARLTYDFFRKRHFGSENEGSFYLGATTNNGIPIGLAIIQVYPITNTMELLSIVVAKTFRNLGVGTELLKAIPILMTELNVNKTITSYSENLVARSSLESIFTAQAWAQPEPLFDMHWVDVRSYLETLKPGLIQEVLAEHTVKPFRELSQNQLKTFDATITEAGELEWMFGYPKEVETWPEHTSGWIVLNADNEVMAWVLSDHNADNCAAYPVLYVRKPFRRSALGLALLSYAWKQNLARGIELASGNIRCENTPMLNLLSNRMGEAIVKKKRVLSRELTFQ